MRRHVFPSPRSALAALCLLGALGVVRAQDGGDPPPDEPKPAEQGSEAKDGEGGDAGAEPGAAGAAEPEPPGPPAVGEAFPASLPLREMPRAGTGADEPGEEPSIEIAALRGEQARPVVLVFWSSRCPVCKRYGEVLAKLETAFGDRVALVLVAVGAGEEPEKVREAVEAAQLRTKVLLDTDRAGSERLGVRVTPTAFVIDAEGVLRYRGPIDDDRRARSRDARELLRPAVEAVLDGKAVETSEARAFGSALR